MQDDVAPVLKNPGALFVTFGCGRLVSAGFHLDSHFVAHRVHLTSTGSGRNDEEVHDRCHAGQIEYHGVLTAKFFANFGNVTSIFETASQTSFR